MTFHSVHSSASTRQQALGRIHHTPGEDFAGPCELVIAGATR